MSKSVYVRVDHDLELLRYVRSNDSFNFPLGLTPSLPQPVNFPG